MPDASTTLDARYGRTRERVRRGRLTLVGVVAALVLAAAAWALWTGLGGAAGTLEADTVSSKVIDAGTTEVRWLVTGRADAALVCAIEARDDSAVVVGLVEQTIPVTGSADRAGDTVVRTVRRASNGLIVSCRDA